MKWKVIAVVVVLLLILAQILFGGKRAPNTPDAPVKIAAETAPAETPSENAATEVPSPSPDDVAAIEVGENGADLRLSRAGNGWNVATAHDDAPANADKAEILLRNLLSGRKRPVSLGETANTGLGDGEGLPVSLKLKDGGSYDVALGLRPAGSYDATYVRFPDGRVASLAADIRGDLGLWKNAHDAKPDPSAWLETRALSFNAADAVRVEATYPDHHIAFEKSPEGEWQPRDYLPGGRWSLDGLRAWLRDLGDFRIADVVHSDEFAHDKPEKTHSIVVTLDGGEKKTVSVQPNHGGEGMLVETSDYPGRVFHLPEWRFRKYFRRMPFLFPDAVPAFELSQVRFIDILRSGEKVKIARRDGGWHLVALSYPLRADQVDRLARLLSAWRPEDYAAPDFKAIRPNYGSPMVEVTLEGGVVHQYRLAGRHPLFPWRYVTLDGREIFSVTDAEAGVMFPGFADIMDLGRVFHKMAIDDVDSVDLSDAEGKTALSFARDADGGWSVKGSGQELGLLPIESERILGELMQWRVTGFYDVDSHPGTHPPQHILRVAGSDGREQTVTILQPEERDIPFLAENNRGYLVDRADFQNWLAATRETGHRLNLAAERARRDAEEHVARQIREREAAEREAAAEREEKAKQAAVNAVTGDGATKADDDGDGSVDSSGENSAGSSDEPDADVRHDDERDEPESSAPERESTETADAEHSGDAVHQSEIETADAPRADADESGEENSAVESPAEEPVEPAAHEYEETPSAADAAHDAPAPTPHENALDVEAVATEAEAAVEKAADEVAETIEQAKAEAEAALENRPVDASVPADAEQTETLTEPLVEEAAEPVSISAPASTGGLRGRIRYAGRIEHMFNGVDSNADANVPVAPDNSEETSGEPAGGDLLIHPAVDVNTVGDVIEDITSDSGVLVPEAAVVHDVAE